MKKILFLISFFIPLGFIVSPVFAVDVIVGSGVANDPYFQMNSANLNTMNSYIIPVKNDIEPTSYEELKYRLQKDPTARFGYRLVTDYKGSFKDQVTQGLRLHLMSTFPAIVLMFVFIGLFWYFGVKRSHTFFSEVFRIFYEGIWNFFSDVVGEKQPLRIRHFVVSLFCIILLANLFGLVNDFIRFAAPQRLRRVTAPTGEFEFDIALAIVATVVTLFYQGQLAGGPHKLLHEYIPITGKGVMDGDGIVAKFGDILISLFMGLLDIVGLFAKIISLSLRLFGNMSSGSILLNVIFIGLGGVTVALMGFNLQIGLPIAIYLQGILGSVIQAFVFTLLVSMGIRLLNE